MSIYFENEKTLVNIIGICSTEQVKEFVPIKRSLRIYGHSTTIRLEKAFWSVLELLAEEEGLSVTKLIEKISDTCLIANDKNLASCLRVICLKYVNVYN